MEEQEYKRPILLKDLGMLYPTENSKQKRRFGLYKCGYCGNEFRVMTKNVKTKNTKSCGCLHKINITTHGISRHRLYKTWVNIVHRCTNPKSKSYVNYGGRGISICEDWLDIKNFIEWAEETYIEGYTLDRIDNNGNYESSNCRWVDKTTQAINQRIKKTNTSGFVGVSWKIKSCKWVSRISIDNIRTNLGYFNTIEEAVQARDNYIIENNLPHKLSSEYKKEIE